MSIQSILYIFTSSFIALFPVMNPIGSAFIVNGFLADLDDQQRKIIFKKVALNCLMIGLGSLAAGHLILMLFGLAIPVIQLGGGFLICQTALGWLSDKGKETENKQKTMDKIDIEEIERRVFYPISFPVSIGPGSISVIFTLMALAPVDGHWIGTGINYLMIGLVIFLMCAILYIFLSQGTVILRRIGPSGNMILNKMIAFITFCIGVQIVVKGIAGIFHLQIL